MGGEEMGSTGVETRCGGKVGGCKANKVGKLVGQSVDWV